MRMTMQYLVVLDAVRQLHCHATVEEIYQYVKKDHPHISMGTVYRNLARLCEHGEIARRQIPGGIDGFDHLCGKHYHARCEKCSRIFDVDMEYKAHLDQEIQDKHGFLFTGSDIMFTCICPDCQNERPAAPSAPN